MSNNFAEKQRKRRLVASLCVVAVSILGLFLVVPRIGLWSVIEAFSGHTHLLFHSACFHDKGSLDWI